MTQPLRAMEVTGSDAPDRTASLQVQSGDGPTWARFEAFYEPSYCGCADCHCIIGRGATAEEAVEAYWEEWNEKYVQ
jgi:hypothetical protein